MDKIDYIDLTVFNNTTSLMPCVINQTSTEVMFPTVEGKTLSVVRFDFNNDYVPAFIPMLRYDNTCETNFVNQFASNWSSVSYHNDTISCNSTNYHILVECNNTSGSTVASFGYVNWACPDPTHILPNAWDRVSVVNNNYYWAYDTFHFASLVQAELQAVFQNHPVISAATSNFDIRLVRIDSTYVLLYPATYSSLFPTLQITFNFALWSLFPFRYYDYGMNPMMRRIHIADAEQYSLNGNSYMSLPTKYSSTSFLPFSRVAIKTNLVSLKAQQTYSNVVGYNMNSDFVLTDYILNSITDVDQMYDLVTFTPSTDNFRPIEFVYNTTAMKTFECEFVLQTPDGIQIPIYLFPNRYASIKCLVKNEIMGDNLAD